MPLLGNPTAAVLYPGKLVFAILPYAWAARIYIVAHSALAFLTMLVLMRSWGTSGLGSAALSALAYAFGAPILFQYCNIIYLIGAAWLPLGIHAVDRWVRLGRRWGLCELAIVLSMQVLGGDPQAAYLLGLASIGYALGPGLGSSETHAAGRVRPAQTGAVAVSVVLAAGGGRAGGLVRGDRSCWRSGCRGCAQSGKPTPPLSLDALGTVGCDGRLGIGRSLVSRSGPGGSAAGASPLGSHVAGPGRLGRPGVRA